MQIGKSTHTWSFDNAVVSFIGGERVVDTDKFVEKNLISRTGALLAIAVWNNVSARCEDCGYSIIINRDTVLHTIIPNNIYFDGSNIRCRHAIILSSKQNRPVVMTHRHYFRNVFMHYRYWALMHAINYEVSLVQDIIIVIMDLVFELYMIRPVSTIKPRARKHFKMM